MNANLVPSLKMTQLPRSHPQVFLESTSVTLKGGRNIHVCNKCLKLSGSICKISKFGRWEKNINQVKLLHHILQIHAIVVFLNLWLKQLLHFFFQLNANVHNYKTFWMFPLPTCRTGLCQFSHVKRAQIWKSSIQTALQSTSLKSYKYRLRACLLNQTATLT